jgi:hypothetical protein
MHDVLCETIMERELRAGLAVWPMKFTMKFPFEWLMAIPGLAKWRRSSKKRSVMVRSRVECSLLLKSV